MLNHNHPARNGSPTLGEKLKMLRDGELEGQKQHLRDAEHSWCFSEMYSLYENGVHDYMKKYEDIYKVYIYI